MPRPNVLLVICHDLGRHLGCYGVDTVRSPNVDRLAAGGVRFTRHFATAPQCSPSRAAMMTGRYPHANGMMGLAHGPFAWEMHPDERHIARIMSDNGHDTVLSGVQHVTQHPETLGFGEILAGRHGACDDVSERFCTWLGGRPKGAKPFYAQVGFFEPHRRFDHGGAVADDSPGVFVPPYLRDCEATRAELAAMQGAIRKMDAAFGRILETLERTRRADNTLVIFTTDHGIAFPRAKCTLYDPGIGTAFILRWPDGNVPRGAVCDRLVSNVDMVPTLLDILGLERPGNLHGVSFAPCLAGGGAPREEIFAEKTFHTYYDPMRCIRTDRWKLIANFHRGYRVEVPTDIQAGGTWRAMLDDLAGPRADFELYDLETDPDETENLAGTAEHAETETDLRRRLRAWMRDTDDPLLAGPVPSPTYTRVLRGLQG